MILYCNQSRRASVTVLTHGHFFGVVLLSQVSDKMHKKNKPAARASQVSRDPLYCFHNNSKVKQHFRQLVGPLYPQNQCSLQSCPNRHQSYSMRLRLLNKDAGVLPQVLLQFHFPGFGICELLIRMEDKYSGINIADCFFF